MKNLCKNSAQYQKKNLFRYNPKLYISRLALNSISSSYLDTLMYTKIQKLCSKILISQVILNFQTDLVIIWVSPRNFVCHTVVWQMRWWWWNNCVTKIGDCATQRELMILAYVHCVLDILSMMRDENKKVKKNS